MSSVTLERNRSPISYPLNPPLFVHIGHGKTASSTIQRALEINADTIRSHGLLISDKHLEFPSHGPIKGHPIGLLNEMMRELPPQESDRRMNECLEGISSALSKEGFHGAVISSENLDNERASRLFRNAPGRFDLRVLYLVRRQDEWLESSWKQWGLKSGATLPKYVEEKLANDRPAFLATARSWQAIGAKMRVVPLHAIGDISALLFDWLGIKDSSPQTVPRMNETLDYSLLEILARNPFLFSGFNDNKIFSMLDELLPDNAPRVGYGLLPEEMRAKIIAHFREENVTLHREFYPELQPLDQYPLRIKEELPQSNSIESIQRYLGINLLLMDALKERLDELSKDSQTLKDDLKALKQCRKEDRSLSNEPASALPVSLWRSIRRAFRRRISSEHERL